MLGGRCKSTPGLQPLLHGPRVGSPTLGHAGEMRANVRTARSHACDNPSRRYSASRTVAAQSRVVGSQMGGSKSV